MPKLGWMPAPSTTGMVAYLTMWGIFTALLFIGTLKISRALQVVFASLTLLFFLLAIGDATENTALKHFTGFEGIFCGAAAIYTGAAQVINELYNKTIFPLGPVKKLNVLQVTKNSVEGSLVD
jgi:succinate-acetate transporter protein